MTFKNLFKKYRNNVLIINKDASKHNSDFTSSIVIDHMFLSVNSIWTCLEELYVSDKDLFYNFLRIFKYSQLKRIINQVQKRLNKKDLSYINKQIIHNTCFSYYYGRLFNSKHYIFDVSKNKTLNTIILKHSDIKIINNKIINIFGYSFKLKHKFSRTLHGFYRLTRLHNNTIVILPYRLISNNSFSELKSKSFKLIYSDVRKTRLLACYKNAPIDISQTELKEIIHENKIKIPKIGQYFIKGIKSLKQYYYSSMSYIIHQTKSGIMTIIFLIKDIINQARCDLITCFPNYI